MNAFGESTDLSDRGFQQPGRFGEQRLGRRSSSHGSAGKLDEHRQCDEMLLGAVMQIAF